MEAVHLSEAPQAWQPDAQKVDKVFTPGAGRQNTLVVVFQKCEQIIRVTGKRQSSPALQGFLASSAYEQTIPRPFCSEIPVLSVILPEHGSDYSSCFKKKKLFYQKDENEKNLTGKSYRIFYGIP